MTWRTTLYLSAFVWLITVTRPSPPETWIRLLEPSAEMCIALMRCTSRRHCSQMAFFAE